MGDFPGAVSTGDARPAGGASCPVRWPHRGDLVKRHPPDDDVSFSRSGPIFCILETRAGEPGR